MRISNDLNDYNGIALAAGNLVTVETASWSSLYVVPKGNSAPARQVTPRVSGLDGAWGVDWTPDNRLVYTSGISGSEDLWIMAADASYPTQLTANAGQNISPAALPDGRSVLFASTRAGGKLTIWRLDLEGGNTKQLTNVPGDVQPRVSPDGRWLIYESGAAGAPTIMKLALDGGTPAPVSEKHGTIAIFPAISLDGHWIAFYQLNLVDVGMDMSIIGFDGAPVHKFPVPAGTEVPAGLAWSRDNRALLYVQSRYGADNIFAVPTSGGTPRQVTHFESDHIFNFALSRDGKQLAVSRGTISRDVVLINFNE